MTNHHPMSYPKLRSLWEFTTNYGSCVRINGLDGLKKWEEMKNVLPTHGDIGGNWICLDIFLVMTKYLHLPVELEDVKIDDKQIQKATWEKYHFYVQHGRIPRSTGVTLVRLMQIAYNKGQYRATLKKENFYSEELLAYYELRKLDDFQTYVSRETLQKFEEIITYDFLDNLVTSI